MRTGPASGLDLNTSQLAGSWCAFHPALVVTCCRSGSCPRPRIAIRRPTDSSGAPVIVDRFIVGDARQRHSAPPECVHGEARRGSVDEESITAVVERHVIRIARPAGT